METTTPPSSGLFELAVDPIVSSYLRDSARWAKFLAIIGFIFCAFFILIALLMGSVMSTYFNVLQGAGGIASSAFTVVYLGVALINFFPCLYLFRFASKMQMALLNNDQELFQASFRNMRAFYRFVGILLIICLCFWALGVLGMILTAGVLHPGGKL